MSERRLRSTTRATVGLLLVFVLAAGIKIAATSGGFYCGYGEASLYYDCDAGSWQYFNTGDGRCTIELSGGVGCYVYLDPGEGWQVITGCVEGECSGWFDYTPSWLQ